MITPDLTTAEFAIRLLGPFSMHIGGKPVKLPGSRRAGNVLVAYLALNTQHPVERSLIAELLWPNSTHTAALDNLRHCLVDLRKALGAQACRLPPPSAPKLSIDLDGAYVDVREFERLIKSNDFNDLADGISMYTGRLFKDCADDWIALERERLQSLFQEGLGRLANHEKTTRTPGAALDSLAHAFAADQLNEPLARALMNAYAAVGNFWAAADCYSKLRTRMRIAFNTGPSEETTTAYKKIRGAYRDEEKKRNPISGSGNKDSVLRGVVPRPLTRLVGRDADLVDIQSSLDTSRIVTLTGFGGIGKTQLAVTVAHASLTEYPDGVWFADLAPLRNASQVPREILSALRQSNVEGDGRDAEADLFRALGERSLLLIIDNCEHLLAGCTRLVTKLLEKCGNLRILATSRKALRVPGEKVWQVPALSLPGKRFPSITAAARTTRPSQASISTTMEYSGIRLFVERAAQARQMFDLTTENLSGVVEICRRLDGIPLAIELAAPWVRSLSVEQLRMRLEIHFDFLKSQHSPAAHRHRTLSAAVDWSYTLLPHDERQVWRQISMFADGFTLEAAEAIIDAPQGESRLLELITSLIDSSILAFSELNGEGRYILPETLRQYGLTRQEWSDVEQANLFARYVQYFAQLGEAAAPNLLGENQAAWLDKIDQERGNLRTAFEYAKKTKNGADGLKLAAAVWRYYYVRGYYSEGYDAIANMLKLGDNVDAAIRAPAESAAGNLSFHVGEHSRALGHYETALKLYDGANDTTGRARSLASLGLIANAKGEFGRARALLEESRDLLQMAGDNRGLSGVLGNLAIIACNEEDYASAYRIHRESIQLFRETGDMQRLGMALANLAGLYVSQGDLEPVLPLLLESLEISRTQGSAAILAHCLVIASSVAVANGNYQAAAVIAGADAALRMRFPIPLPVEVRAEQALTIAGVKEALKLPVFQKMYERGEIMEHGEIVTYLVVQFQD